MWNCLSISNLRAFFQTSNIAFIFLTVDVLMTIMERVCQALDKNSKTWDISKSFDRVWHTGLLHKFFELIQSLLSNHKTNIILTATLVDTLGDTCIRINVLFYF